MFRQRFLFETGIIIVDEESQNDPQIRLSDAFLEKWAKVLTKLI